MRRGEELSISNAGGEETRYYASMVYVEIGEPNESMVDTDVRQ
jgi:hypothetical protein